MIRRVPLPHALGTLHFTAGCKVPQGGMFFFASVIPCSLLQGAVCFMGASADRVLAGS